MAELSFGGIGGGTIEQQVVVASEADHFDEKIMKDE
jgi:hypothetical protein